MSRIQNLELNFESFLAFCLSAKGTVIYYKGKMLPKAAVYWGVINDTIDPKALRMMDKPGWKGGSLVLPAHYSLWLFSAKFYN
jgi:hypothetical protein